MTKRADAWAAKTYQQNKRTKLYNPHSTKPELQWPKLKTTMANTRTLKLQSDQDAQTEIEDKQILKYLLLEIIQKVSWIHRRTQVLRRRQCLEECSKMRLCRRHVHLHLWRSSSNSPWYSYTSYPPSRVLIASSCDVWQCRRDTM